MIPMVGMVQSLNVSVAAAVVLYEAQRQRQQAGMYDQLQLSEEECQRMLFEGGFPNFKDMCERKNIPYPQINEQGEIVADDSWWLRMQMTKKGHRQLESSPG